MQYMATAKPTAIPTTMPASAPPLSPVFSFTQSSFSWDVSVESDARSPVQDVQDVQEPVSTEATDEKS
eukprot:COSAG06_NODE_3231_length_5643_cov_6.529942_2_plen_68_part_00